MSNDDVYTFVDIPLVGLKRALTTSFGDDVLNYGSLNDVYVTLDSGKRALLTATEGGASVFSDDLQTALGGQTEFTATFDINRVVVDGITFTPDEYTGQGTDTITFNVARSDGQQVYLTT